MTEDMTIILYELSGAFTDVIKVRKAFDLGSLGRVRLQRIKPAGRSIFEENEHIFKIYLNDVLRHELKARKFYQRMKNT